MHLPIVVCVTVEETRTQIPRNVLNDTEFATLIAIVQKAITYHRSLGYPSFFEATCSRHSMRQRGGERGVLMTSSADPARSQWNSVMVAATRSAAHLVVVSVCIATEKEDVFIEVAAVARDAWWTTQERAGTAIWAHVDNVPTCATSVPANFVSPCPVSCLTCGARVKTRKVCSRCAMARYCGPQCQRDDWKRHKLECRPVQFDEDGLAVYLQRAEKNPSIGAVVLGAIVFWAMRLFFALICGVTLLCGLITKGVVFMNGTTPTLM